MPLAFELMSKDRCPFTIFYNGDGQNNAETNLTPGQQGRARLHDTQTCITGAGQNAGGVVLNTTSSTDCHDDAEEPTHRPQLRAKIGEAHEGRGRLCPLVSK